MSISLVIPVFNEEHQIKDCLDSIVSQSVIPDEVIVVDNNCTDNTIEIAKTFPFVKIIKESKKGRGFARSAGFDMAKSEIIGRLDADSRLSPDWVERVKEHFDKDDALAGLTGIGRTSFIPGVRFIRTTLFSRSYYWFVHAGFHTITMWGATMAIRKNTWENVKDKVINDDSLVHEDQDLSLWIASGGGKILQDDNLVITADGQAYINIKKALRYLSLYRKTKRIHLENGNIAKIRQTGTGIVGYIISLFVIFVLGALILGVGLVRNVARAIYRRA